MNTGSSSSQQSGIQCMFCMESDQPRQASSNLFAMMNQAIIAKHLSHSNSHLILPIDILLKIEQPNSKDQITDFIVFRELQYLDNCEENMKRQYLNQQFTGKIEMLSEYYKFHKDIPHIISPIIQKILSKYYDHKRQFDYKCIKRQLKQEQGLSITSVEQTITENSQTIQDKSKYSTLLHALSVEDRESKTNKQDLMSDSNLLADICKEIGDSLSKMKIFQQDFKGSFYENNEYRFQNYVKNQRLKRINKDTGKQSKFGDNYVRNLKKITQANSKRSNYFKMQKKSELPYSQNETIKQSNKNRDKNRTKKIDKDKGDQKKKFIYNTNIKIQIQNGFFYGNNLHPDQFHSAPKKYDPYNVGGASRKSLIGKITALNDEKYRTPVRKIYQPQEVETTNRRRNNSLNKQRMKTRESKQFKDFIFEQQQPMKRQNEERFENRYEKRTMSTQNLKKQLMDNNYEPKLKMRTISVTKLKADQRPIETRENRDLGGRQRISSSQNIRKRSITLSHGKDRGSKQKIIPIPIAKYSSSEMQDKTKLKGISIKDLLTKKLNIYDR